MLLSTSENGEGSMAISIIGYYYELRRVGFTEEQCAVQARMLERVIASIKQEIQQEVRALCHS